MFPFAASRKKKQKTTIICFPTNTVNCRFSLFVSYNHSTGGYVQDVEYGNTAQLGDCHGKAQALLRGCKVSTAVCGHTSLWMLNLGWAFQ